METSIMFRQCGTALSAFGASGVSRGAGPGSCDAAMDDMVTVGAAGPGVQKRKCEARRRGAEPGRIQVARGFSFTAPDEN